MRYEIQKHWEKLKKISRLSDERMQVSYLQVISKLKFINEEIIPEGTWIEAENLLRSIDEDDIDFVALTKFLRAHLWTGDKVLHTGLIQAGFKKVLNSSDLFSLRAARRM